MWSVAFTHFLLLITTSPFIGFTTPPLSSVAFLFMSLRLPPSVLFLLLLSFCSPPAAPLLLLFSFCSPTSSYPPSSTRSLHPLPLKKTPFTPRFIDHSSPKAKNCAAYFSRHLFSNPHHQIAFRLERKKDSLKVSAIHTHTHAAYAHIPTNR